MTILGIDLGTTNSLVAYFRDGTSNVVPNSLGKPLTPSVVGIDDDGTVLVGAAARERLLTHPELTVANFKRSMGTQKVVRLGKRAFRPEELSALVLRSLKADAEARLNEKIDEAVISVPAYFSDAQRKATKAAGELAGLKVERLINEPTAAAIAYGLHERAASSKFLVFDLGGGTFDVSVLELFEGVMEVHASAGDNFLGGEDFVEAIVKRFLAQAKLSVDDLSPVDRSRLFRQAELAKLALSQHDTAELQLLRGGKEHKWALARGEFESLSSGLLERIALPVMRVLRDSKTAPDTLDAVVLAGGATRMPMIRSMVARLFGKFPTAHINPDEVVAIGAGVQAGLLARDEALKETVLTDVCPYTLGTDTSREVAPGRRTHGHFVPIIERNTVVPCSRSKLFAPAVDFQPSVDIDVYQGESRLVADNIHLGKLEVPLPRRKRDDVSVDVRFTYDMNGILEVEVTIEPGGSKHQTVIEKNPGVLTKAEIAARLKELEALKIHPREAMANRTLLARTERVYQESLGDTRDMLGRMASEFELALENQDEKKIAETRAELQRALDYIEANWNP